jgi:hypothetical protein
MSNHIMPSHPPRMVAVGVRSGWCGHALAEYM